MSWGRAVPGCFGVFLGGGGVYRALKEFYIRVNIKVRKGLWFRNKSSHISGCVRVHRSFYIYKGETTIICV